MSIACPKCHNESKNGDEARTRWCSECQDYHMKLHQIGDGIQLDAIVGEIMYAYKSQIDRSDPFFIGHETFEKDGMSWWRAWILVGGRRQMETRLHHAYMSDALCELAHLVDARFKS